MIPQQNQIVFPAAILQAPFYDLHQSSSANYGGIGAVIAHEISHAFDTNGASFDEHGSLKDWWKPEDYEAFTARTQKGHRSVEGQDSYGAKINGKLTVSEKRGRSREELLQPLKLLRKRKISQQKNSSPTLLASGA